MGVGAGLYMCDVVKKSSRSLSHLLMSSCYRLVALPVTNQLWEPKGEIHPLASLFWSTNWLPKWWKLCCHYADYPNTVPYIIRQSNYTARCQVFEPVRDLARSKLDVGKQLIKLFSGPPPGRKISYYFQCGMRYILYLGKLLLSATHNQIFKLLLAATDFEPLFS